MNECRGVRLSTFYLPADLPTYLISDFTQDLTFQQPPSDKLRFDGGTYIQDRVCNFCRELILSFPLVSLYVGTKHIYE